MGHTKSTTSLYATLPWRRRRRGLLRASLKRWVRGELVPCYFDGPPIPGISRGCSVMDDLAPLPCDVNSIW
jgi:hypothetical protein